MIFWLWVLGLPGLWVLLREFRDIQRAAEAPGGERPAKDHGLQSLSILCAFRNEQDNLPALLEALKPQLRQFPQAEVLLVDDGSEDAGAALVAEAARENTQIHLINGLGQGKTSALVLAAKAAQGEILLHTDADCRPGTQWLKQHLNAHRQGARLVFAHVLCEGSAMTRLESLLASAQVAGGVQRQQPPFARGNNWSLRREDFEAIGGYGTLTAQGSGDDIFLLQRLLAKGVGPSRFLLESTAAIRTREDPDPDRSARRRRHYSKWRALGGTELWRHLLLASAFVLLPLLCLVAWRGGEESWQVLALAQVVFGLGYGWFAVRAFGRTLNGPESGDRCLDLLPLYPLLVLYYGLLGGLAGYHWKGVKRHTRPLEGEHK